VCGLDSAGSGYDPVAGSCVNRVMNIQVVVFLVVTPSIAAITSP